MDNSDCRAFLETELPIIQAFLCLDRWDLTLRLDGPLAHDFSSSVEFDFGHHNATILFDPEKIESQDDIVDCLFHELCHLILTPFEGADIAIKQVLSEESKKINNQLMFDAENLTVSNLEMIWRKWMRTAYLEYSTGGYRLG